MFRVCAESVQSSAKNDRERNQRERIRKNLWQSVQGQKNGKRCFRLSGTGHKNYNDNYVKWHNYTLLHTSIYTWLAEFSNYAKLCTFCRIELHSSKSFFFSTRGINRSHLCRGRAYTPSIPHKMLITAGHGRRPAMRVSERVHPTARPIAELAPLTIQAAGNGYTPHSFSEPVRKEF